MKLTSPAFEHNGFIPEQYTCDGADCSPPLIFSEVPPGTKSLVLIMDDPDAPARVWDHWIVFNMPADTGMVPEGQEPPGIHGLGTSGNLSYHGPCPPDKEHRYFFRLYALDWKLTLAEGVGKKEIERAMFGHIIDEAQLMGRYDRPRNR